MRARSCTIDSSCLIALDHLDLVPQLSLLFSIVLVPKRVRDEISKRRAGKDRLQLLFNSYAFVQRCDGYDQGTVDFLLTERARQGWQDRGEVEAAVQASQFGANVVIDDRWGSGASRARGFGVPRNSMDPGAVLRIGPAFLRRSSRVL